MPLTAHSRTALSPLARETVFGKLTMEGGGEGALGTNPDEGEYLLCYFFVLSEVPAVNIIRKM